MIDSPMRLRPPRPTSSKPVNRCIYCGHADIDDLSDEHVIPYGFNSHLKLKKASCSACAAVTSSFEGHVLGAMYGDFRGAQGAWSRQKKSKPRTRPIWAEYDDRCELLDVPIEDHPAPFAIVRFNGWPRLMTGEIDGPTATISAVGSGAALKKFPGVKAFRVRGMLRLEAYARMVAKIAHAAAVHHLGVDGFVPMLQPFILSGAGKVSDYIGCAPGELAPTAERKHELKVDLATSDAKSYVVCEVSLFANFGVPPYLVVTGTPNELTGARMIADHYYGPWKDN